MTDVKTLSLKSLCRSIRYIDPPTFDGQLKVINLTSRLDELNMEVPALCDDNNKDVDNKTVQFIPVTLIGVKYCRHLGNCWYEWELRL